MKRTVSTALLAASILGLTACSSMKEVEVRKTAAHPDWYQECAQLGTEGWFWMKADFVYSCGMGESLHAQASEAQAEAFALSSFASRIGTRVNSLTKVEIIDERKSTHTKMETSTDNTRINNQLEAKKYQYVLNGKYHTYVRLKMTKDAFNGLLAEAKKS